jgi:hypothetical protein
MHTDFVEYGQGVDLICVNKVIGAKPKPLFKTPRGSELIRIEKNATAKS